MTDPLLSSRHEPLPAEFVDAFAHARGRFGRLGSRVLFFSLIGSTNDVALQLAAEGNAEGTVVLADAQTRGRGRRGRSWVSSPVSGLYVSVVLAPARAKVAPDRATALVTLAAGVAIAEAIETTTGLSPHIKWPNDLFVGRRKLAGILAEGMVLGTSADDGHQSEREKANVVLGYGINVGPMGYVPALADRATSLDSELGRPIDRAALCAETLAALGSRYDQLLDGRFNAILDAWRLRAPASRGARVVWNSPEGPRNGVTAGIDDGGALLVIVGDRVERMLGGELTWL